MWRMPWHQEAMKDAANCEKPRGAVSELRSVGFRMGKPTIVLSYGTLFIGGKRGELKHLSIRRKRK
jgi:hypothetical protein